MQLRHTRNHAVQMLAVMMIVVGVGGAMCDEVPTASVVDVPLAAVERVTDDIEAPCDSIWLVSTRQLGAPCGAPTSIDLRVMRLDDCGNVTPATLDELLAEDHPNCTTLIHVHGNRNTYHDSIEYGLKAYRQIVRRCANRTPVRFVIWSWPSSRMPGALRDVRVKACRTNVDGFYLAWFMSRLGPDTPLSLFGFSYGARIITGGLHALHGGSLFGRTLHDRVDSRRSIRVALCAAAIHKDWLCPGRCHGNAFFGVDELLNVYNDRDPALQRYRIVERRSRPHAVGYTGLPSRCRVCPTSQCNARNLVGRTHELVRYINSECVVKRVRRVLLDRVEQ